MLYITQTSDLFYTLFESYLYSNSVDSSESFINLISLLSPEIFLILAIFFYLCFVKNFNNFYISSLFFYFVLFVELILILCNCIYIVGYGNYTPKLFFYSCFSVDFYSTFCKLFIVIILLLISAFSEFKFTWNKPANADIYIPIYFFLFFSLFLLSACDLFCAYLALEGVSLSLYTLAANTYHKRVAIESTVKYFVFGGISNGLLVYGNSLIFGLCGSLNYIEIKYLLNTLSFNLSSIEVCLALICFITVFLFKIAAFPCHMWSPDVYEGVWLPITAILMVLVKLLYFFFFLKVFFYIFIKLLYLWQPLLLLSSLGSLIVGSFGIIGQNRIKRLMAYSSINHVSFLLLGMACGTLSGLTVTLLYLLVYSLTLLIFFGFMLNSKCLITGRSLIYLSDFANITKFSNLGSQGLLIILFSMGGLPPLAGFFVKFYIYIEAVSSGFYIFVIFSLIVTIVSTFYYLFFLKSIFFDKNLWSKIISVKFLRKWHFYVIVISCLFLICFLFINNYVYDFVYMMSAALFCPNFLNFLF